MRTEGIIKPCPWCGSTNIDWSIPAFTMVGRPFCVECEATGPSFIASTRTDRSKLSAEAIEAWNGARS